MEAGSGDATVGRAISFSLIIFHFFFFSFFFSFSPGIADTPTQSLHHPVMKGSVGRERGVIRVVSFR